MDVMSLRSGQQALQRDIRQQRAQASQQIIGGIGTLAGAGFDAYTGGVFSGGSMGVNSTDRYFRKNNKSQKTNEKKQITSMKVTGKQSTKNKAQKTNDK